jgi:hypothetical protein
LGPLGHHAFHGGFGGGGVGWLFGRRVSGLFVRRDSRSFPFGKLSVRMTIL